MVVKPCGFHLKCPNVYMINNKLEYVEKSKCLGVIICCDRKDDENMLRHLHSFRARSNSIIGKCHNCSIISMDLEVVFMTLKIF